MSDGAVVLKRKRKRGRVEGSGSAPAAVTKETAPPTEQVKPKMKKKKKKKEAAALLSFDAEADADIETFQLQKSDPATQSAKFVPNAKLSIEVSKKIARSVNSGGAGSYSAADLAELKRSTSLAKGKRPAALPVEEELWGGPTKPAVDAAFRPRVNTSVAAAAAAAAAADVEPTDALPTQEAIALAKKKREKARKQAEFIPLDGRNGRSGHEGGQLQQGDDVDFLNMDEGEMSFGEAARRTQKLSARARVGVAIHDGLDVDDGDEDFQVFEQQQIMSGVKAHQRQPPPPPPPPRAQVSGTARRHQAMPSALAGGDSATVIDSLDRSLREALESMTEVHTGHKAHVARLKDDLEQSRSLMEPLQSELDAASERYRFYHETRGYLGDMLDCLDNKAPAISECEGKMHTLWKERRDALTVRSATHTVDLINLATAPTPQRLDDFGRDASAAWYARVTATRQRHAAAAAAARETAEHDWLPSDDDDDTTTEKRRRQLRDETIRNSRLIFADVLLDFCDYKRIAERFEGWKRTHRRSYLDTFAGDSLRRILQPSVRLDILDWNPLEDGAQNFEEADWAAYLVEYGVLDGQDDAEDPDNNLVPYLVDEVVVPKLAGIVEFVWNPLSHKQSKRAKDHVTTLLEYPIQENMKVLFAALVSRLKQVVLARTALPTFTQVGEVTPEHEAAAGDLLEGDLQVVKSVVFWADLLNLATIQELSLKVVCERMLQSPMMTRAEHAIGWHERIAAVLPSAWFTPQGTPNARQYLDPVSKSLLSQSSATTNAAEAQRVLAVRGHYSL